MMDRDVEEAHQRRPRNRLVRTLRHEGDPKAQTKAEEGARPMGRGGGPAVPSLDRDSHCKAGGRVGTLAQVGKAGNCLEL